MSHTVPGRRPHGVPRRAFLPPVMAVAAALLLAACGSSDDTSDDASPQAAGAKSRGKVAVLFVGNKTDGSFSQAIYEGGQRAAKEDNVSVQSVGNLQTPAQYLAQGSSFAQAGYKFVLLGHGAMGPVAVQLAKRFPKTQFCVPNAPPTGTAKLPANVCFFYPAGEVGAFRAGILAGLATKSGVVASNQGFNFPGINAQTQAFALGARCVNPKVKVLNTLVNSDIDPAVTKSATEAQIAKGADIILGTTSAMPGLFEAAASHPGTYAIGQYVDASKVAPDAVLASSIVNLQQIIPYVIGQSLEGKAEQVSTFGVGAPVPVGLLKLNDQLAQKLPEDVRKRNDALQAQVTEGKFDIPSFDKIGSMGAAEKIDVASLGCTQS